MPAKAQLGALRSVLGGLVPGDEGKTALAWLDTRLANKRRRKDWASVEPAVRRLLTEPGLVWGVLGVREAELTLTEDGGAALRSELWPEAVRAVFDALVRKHVRVVAPGGQEGRP